MNELIKKTMNKWGITSIWQFIVINIVFALAGMTIIYERRPLFDLFGITAQTPFWIKFLTWLAIVFPCYQINLIVYGTLLGQFKFFWNKEKKLFLFLTGKRKKPQTAPLPPKT